MVTWPIHIIVPMTPPGVNHYVKHTRSGRHYKTKEALAFEKVGAIACAGMAISAKTYSVRVEVYLGYKVKGDIDGFAKQTLDLIANCGVLLDRKGRRSTDAHITELHMTKHRDIDRPRCEIWVRSND